MVLAGTGHAGHRNEPPLGQPDFQWLDGVDGPGAQGDGAQRKELRLRGAGAGREGVQVGKEGPDAGGRALGHLLHSALCQDGAAVFTGTGPISMSQSASRRISVS